MRRMKGPGPRDLKKLFQGQAGSLVMGVNERAEVRVTFRFLVWAASRLLQQGALEEGQGWIPLGWAGRTKQSQLECTKCDYFGV